MSRQAWRYNALIENTGAIEEFCAKHNLSIKYLNDGYQLRINGVIDLYPVRKKWHYLKTGQRGEWDDINDLDLSIFEPEDINTARVGDKLVIMNGRDPLKYLDLTTDKIHKYPVRKWWQFWRKK